MTRWPPRPAAFARFSPDTQSVLIAFSGGVDSAYLAIAAAEALGDRALAVTADSPSYPDTHRQLALTIARDFGFAHEVIHTTELDRPEYRANPANRCYYCKDELYSRLAALARERGIAVVVDGNNADDRGDYRPGRQAAREHGVRSPLDEADLAKDDIRELARAAGLASWDEPASACLSSRIPYGQEVTNDALRQIERAEARPARARLPHLPRPSSRHHGAPRDRARPRCRARSSPTSTRAWSRRSRPSGISTSASICRATAWEA